MISSAPRPKLLQLEPVARFNYSSLQEPLQPNHWNQEDDDDFLPQYFDTVLDNHYVVVARTFPYTRDVFSVPSLQHICTIAPRPSANEAFGLVDMEEEFSSTDTDADAEEEEDEEDRTHHEVALCPFQLNLPAESVWFPAENMVLSIISPMEFCLAWISDDGNLECNRLQRIHITHKVPKQRGYEWTRHLLQWFSWNGDTYLCFVYQENPLTLSPVIYLCSLSSMKRFLEENPMRTNIDSLGMNPLFHRYFVSRRLPAGATVESLRVLQAEPFVLLQLGICDYSKELHHAQLYYNFGITPMQPELVLLSRNVYPDNATSEYVSLLNIHEGFVRFHVLSNAPLHSLNLPHIKLDQNYYQEMFRSGQVQQDMWRLKRLLKQPLYPAYLQTPLHLCSLPTTVLWNILSFLENPMDAIRLAIAAPTLLPILKFEPLTGVYGTMMDCLRAKLECLRDDRVMAFAILRLVRFGDEKALRWWMKGYREFALGWTAPTFPGMQWTKR